MSWQDQRARMSEAILGGLPLLGVLLGAGWLLFGGVDALSHDIRTLPVHQLIWVHPIILLALFHAGFLLWQTWLYYRYRPFLMRDDVPLPSITVIIPAYNEGPMVRRSIESVAKANYPPELLEVLVVDDGSRDDTKFHMEQARRDFPRLARMVHFGGNQGKRAALEAGFRAARGEIVVTIDSDSEIEPDTLRHMVAPFQSDPLVGGVAGRVSVLNRGELIGAMLDVNYALAFDFGRAAQSAFGAVACCPGALSAFRRELILPHLKGWMEQQFLGRRVSHGEDQALTNIVLRQGFETVYQRHAVIHTLAPQRYDQLCKMFLRWERSFVVEGFSFAHFMFTPYRARNRWLPAINFVLINIRLVTLYAGLVAIPIKLVERPERALDYTLAMLLTAFCTALYYLRKERSPRFLYGVVYAFYSFFLLQWILPWAVVTVRDERWGTR